MKILLIRNNEPNSSDETDIIGIQPPLSLARMTSVLRNGGYYIILLDNL